MNQIYSTKQMSKFILEISIQMFRVRQTPLSTGKVNRKGSTQLKISLIKRELVKRRNITLFVELKLHGKHFIAHFIPFTLTEHAIFITVHKAISSLQKITNYQ